jgi:hypothetical protein
LLAFVFLIDSTPLRFFGLRGCVDGRVRDWRTYNDEIENLARGYPLLDIFCAGPGCHHFGSGGAFKLRNKLEK